MRLAFGYNFGKPSFAIHNGDKPDKTDWRDVDFAVVGGDDGKALYEQYKRDYLQAKTSREAYEAHMRAKLGFEAKEAKATGQAKAKQGLADYLASRGVSGFQV